MHSSIIRLLALAISAVSLSIGVSAQTDSNPLQEIIVTSSLVPIPLRQIGTSVSVITQDEINAHGNISLVDVLRQQPAIGSSNNGGAGKTTALRIRGEEGFRTLTVFDGIRLLDPSGTQVGSAIEHILSDGIARMEILRGPQGLAYGADAGGVVNISTRPVEDSMSANMDAQMGEFGTEQFAGNISGKSDTVGYFFSATNYETDGYNTRKSDTLLADDDGYENTTLHGRIEFQLNDNWRIDFVHRDVDGDSEFDGCFSGTTVHDCSSKFELSASRGSAEYNSVNFNHSFAVSNTETDRKNFALGVSSFTANGELERMEYVGSATNLPGFDLVWGIDHEEASNNGVSRDNEGYFIEYLSEFSDIFFLTAGLRHDENDDFGTNTSHRISAAYLVDWSNNAVLKFKGALGTGFRAPSPFEIAYNSGSFAFPPASLISLSQEESDGWELGLEYVLGNRVHLEAVYFDQEIKDAIFFDLAGFSGYLQDTGTSTSEGIELTADIQLFDNLRLVSNYTFNDTERPNGLQRLRRPEKLLNLGLNYSGMDGRLNINGYYRMSRDSIDEIFGSDIIDLDDFNVFDLSANYNVSDSISLYARLENAFDEDYEEITGFNSPERAFYIGVRLDFFAQ